MAEHGDDNLVFGRYSREDCGLPPDGIRSLDPRLGILKTAALTLVMLCLAWLGGTAMGRWREIWLAELPSRIAGADAAEIPGLMARGRMYATALPENAGMRRSLAYAAVTAAERAPRRIGFYANAAGLFRGMDGDPSSAYWVAESFAASLTAAGAYAEAGEYPAAFAALERAEEALEAVPEEQQRPFRLLLVNTQSYFLATAPESRGGDVEKALKLARLMVTSRDRLPGGDYASGSAAFLDTLATAWAGNGDYARALSTQSLALGLAESQGLDVYLRHFDEFSKGNRNGK